MFQNGFMMLGRYRPRDSFLHRLDARAKILPVTLVLVLALLTRSFAFYGAILAGLVAALMFSHVSPRTLWVSFRPILVLVLITVGYHLVFSARDSRPLVDLFGWTLTAGAVHEAGFFSLRLVLFVSVAFLITLTSSPSELAEAFAKLTAPLARLRVPVSELAMILFIAIRFIPILFEEFLAIRNAQTIRGVDFTGSFISRLRKSIAIVIPVFVSAIQRADDLALAIEVRGYVAGRRRTFYSRTRFGRPEWSFMLLTAAGIAILYRVTL